jgi:hypothetical protein
VDSTCERRLFTAKLFPVLSTSGLDKPLSETPTRPLLAGANAATLVASKANKNPSAPMLQ